MFNIISIFCSRINVALQHLYGIPSEGHLHSIKLLFIFIFQEIFSPTLLPTFFTVIDLKFDIKKKKKIGVQMLP